MASKPTYLTLELSAAAITALDGLVAKAGLQTRAEAIRDALRLYDFLLAQRSEGYRIHLVKDGKAKEILFADDAPERVGTAASSETIAPVISILPRLKSVGGCVSIDIDVETHQRLEEIREELEQASLNDTLKIVLEAFGST